MTYLVMWINWCHWNMSNKCKLCPLVWKVLWMPTPLLPPHHLLPTSYNCLLPHPLAVVFQLTLLPPTTLSCFSPHPLCCHLHHLCLLSTNPGLSPHLLASHFQPLASHYNPLLVTSIPFLSPPFLLIFTVFLSTPFPLIPLLFLSSHPFASHSTPVASSHLLPHPTQPFFHLTHLPLIPLLCLSFYVFVSHPACLPVTPTPPASYLDLPLVSHPRFTSKVISSSPVSSVNQVNLCFRTKF